MNWEATLAPAVGTAITIIATGAVTLLSVWLKGRYDLQQQKALIEAEESRAEVDRQRALETAVAERQLAIEAAKVEKEVTGSEARRANADRVLDTLADVLGGLSTLPDDASFEEVEEMWNRDHDARARRAAELLSDSDTRVDLSQTMDTLAAFSGWARANELRSMGGWHGRLQLHMMIELVGTVARGEARSEFLNRRVAAADERVRRVFEYSKRPTTADDAEDSDDAEPTGQHTATAEGQEG